MNTMIDNEKKRKVVIFCARMITWEPWPRMSGISEPVSWWFHRKSDAESGYEHNWLGELWDKVWWAISDTFRVHKRERK